MSNKKYYAAPNHLNKEPFLTVRWMENINDTLFYVQTSEDENNPIWMRYGDIVEMLTRHTDDIEVNILPELFEALKTYESISAEMIKNWITFKR